MRLLLVFIMVNTCPAELPSTTLMYKLLHFCVQNGHKSILLSYESTETLVKISRIFFQHLQTRVVVPNQLFLTGNLIIC